MYSFMQHALHPLFHPKTLAVVGASDRYGTVGRHVFSQLLANCRTTTLIPINPKHKTIGSLKSYESLSEAAQEHTIDTVVLIIAADKINGLVREAAKLAIHQVVIINELNPVPSSIRRQLEKAAETAIKSGINLLSLSPLGVSGLFSEVETTASAYIGQAEGVAACMDSYIRERGIQFSRFLTLNPQGGDTISTGQLIDYIASEESCSAILVQISVLDYAHELISALAAVARRKTMVVLSTLENKTDETLLVQALTRYHILVVHTLTEFLTAAKLIHTRLISRGNRLAIISNTPQITALAVNALPSYQLKLAEVKPAAKRMIERILPYKPERTNPLYLTNDVSAGVLQSAIEQQLSDEHIDAVLLIYAGRNDADNRYMAKIVSRLQHKTRKPLMLVWLGSADTLEIRQLFNQNKNLHFKQPEHALHALAQLNLYREHQQQRHQLSTFHDYRYATAAAEELHKHLRPMLPVAVLPASKNAVSHLLKALRLERLGRKKNQIEWRLDWVRQAPFGQVLTLHCQQQTLRLLPPLTPEIAQSALESIGINITIWQEWLLTTTDILNRLPEIHSLQLELIHEDGQLYTQNIKLNLQEPDEKNPNILSPYPQTEEVLTLKDGHLVFLRPIRPEDASLIIRHIETMDDQSRYSRFMMRIDTPPAALVARLSRVDYQREYALILHDTDNQILSMANYTADPNLNSCEFGISTIKQAQGQGLGSLLLQKLIEHARQQGFKRMRAEILVDNSAMQRLALKFGFILSKHPTEHNMVEAHLDL